MYNTYFSSALLTFRTKAPLSFSFNDYSNLLNERFDKNPSSPLCCLCCNCCSCCSLSSFPSNRVLIKPDLFYGLRQSTLIHWSPCRRLIFGARDPYCYRVPNCGLNHSCFDVCCEKSGWGRIERRRKDRIGRLNLNQRYCLSTPDDAEAVISFLSEEVSEEYLGDRAQNGSFRKKVEIERRSNYAGDYWNANKKNERLSQFVTAKSKSEGSRRKEELEERRRREEVRDFRRNEEWKEYRSKEEKGEKEERRTGSRGGTHRGRRPSSSCSSNYSLSYAREYRSDKEAQDENVGLLEASSSGYSRNSRSRRDNFKEEEEDFERQADVEQGEYMEQRTSSRRTGADWELRKKTEKKLTAVEETESQRESSRLHSKIATTSGIDHGEVFSSDKQLGDEHRTITMAANFDEGRRKQYISKGDQEVTDISTKRSSQYQTQFIGREEDLKEGANLINEKRRRYHETIDTSTGMENKSNNQQTSQISETGNVVKRDTKFPSLSESRMKIREEDVALRSSWVASEKRQQAFKQITNQIDLRSALQHSSKISKINDSDGRKTSILQSENGMENQEASASFLSHSAEETNEQRSDADQKVDQRIQSGKGSQEVTNKAVNVTNVSIRHSTDIKRVNYTQVTSVRMTDQGSKHVSSVNPIQEAREIDNQINESIAAVKSRDEAYKATEVSCFQAQNSQEASRSHAYLDMVSQEHSQLINVEEGSYRSSSPTMMPPSRQMLDEGSFYVNPVSGLETLEVPGATSESNSSGICTHSDRRTPVSLKPYRRDGRQEMYREPLDIVSLGDTMVSAQRLEESSKKFIGEYIDMAWNEALASEMSAANLEYEGEKDKKKISSQSGSESSQLKKLDLTRLSGVSGAKGLSDEIWDVTDTSALEPPKTGAPEDSGTIKNTVARRSGRSLWGIISDMVQLHWGSHVETRKSTKISGGKSSLNDSVSSEAWFSGHEPEETSDKNVEKERSMPKEAFSSHHQQLVRPMPGQGEVSDTHSSKSIKRQLETNAPSPSTTYISGSTSKGVSSPAEEENLVWGQQRKSFEGTQSLDGKNSHVSPPSTDAGESSVLPLPSSSMITLTAEEFYGSGRTDVSIGGEMEMKDQPFVAKPIEALGSEGKDGELKQRKLQRNKQVVKDKFDEWEETYTRENEQQKIDEMFMREALLEAKKAADTWEVPVGAVLVQHGKIIARGYNLVEELRDSTAHAEIICIREASNQLRSWRLAESTLYVTLEPCAMCAGAILQARIDALVWGAPNKLLGADGSWIRLFPNDKGGNDTEVRGDEPAAPPHPFHPKMTIRRGILQSECADVMQQFFQLRRRKKVKNKDTPSQPSLPIASHQSKFLRKMHDIFHAFLCL